MIRTVEIGGRRSRYSLPQRLVFGCIPVNLSMTVRFHHHTKSGSTHLGRIDKVASGKRKPNQGRKANILLRCRLLQRFRFSLGRCPFARFAAVGNSARRWGRRHGECVPGSKRSEGPDAGRICESDRCQRRRGRGNCRAPDSGEALVMGWLNGCALHPPSATN